MNIPKLHIFKQISKKEWATGVIHSFLVTAKQVRAVIECIYPVNRCRFSDLDGTGLYGARALVIGQDNALGAHHVFCHCKCSRRRPIVK